MHSQPSKLWLKDEVFQFVGCAIAVLAGLDHGLHEKPHENVLTVEFKLRGICLQTSVMIRVHSCPFVVR